SPLHRHAPSLPTRRSSDLVSICLPFLSWSKMCSAPNYVRRRLLVESSEVYELLNWCPKVHKKKVQELLGLHPRVREISRQPGNRSEEHTSELQSHLNLVCR